MAAVATMWSDGSSGATSSSAVYSVAAPVVLVTAGLTLRLSQDFKVFPCRSLGCTALSLLFAAGAGWVVATSARPWERVLARGQVDIESAAGLVALAISIAMSVLGVTALLEARAARRDERRWTRAAATSGPSRRTGDDTGMDWIVEP